MARLAASCPSGGCLAVQFPDNLAEPSHALMREIAAAPRFRAKLAAEAEGREKIGDFADYDAELSPHCRHIDIWRTVYVHRLARPMRSSPGWRGRASAVPRTPCTRTNAPSISRFIATASPKPIRASRGAAFCLPFPRLFVVAARG